MWPWAVTFRSAVAVLGHDGGDHIAQLFRGLGQLFIARGAAFILVEHVDGHGGRQGLRIGSQFFQGVGRHAPVAGAVGAQLGQGFIVDADDHDLPGGNAPALVQPVLHPPVHPVERSRGDQPGHGRCGQNGDQIFQELFHSDASHSAVAARFGRSPLNFPGRFGPRGSRMNGFAGPFILSRGLSYS